MTSAMSDQDPDSCLVRELQGGNESALSALMARHQEPIYRYLFRYVRNEHDARELTQEVFVRVYFKIGQFQPRAKFITWLYRIATNLCRDRARSRFFKEITRTHSLSTSMPDGESFERQHFASGKNPSELLESTEQMNMLQTAIDALPRDLREAVILAILEDRSHLECAEILRTTAKTIEMRVYRARKILMEKLQKAGY